MTNQVIWLIEGEPWVEYNTRKYLLDQHNDQPEVMQAKQTMLAHPQIKALISELTEWPGEILKSHKTADHPLHKLHGFIVMKDFLK